MLATPGLTGIRDHDLARSVLLHDALRAVPIVREVSGNIVDVGSGGGSPGIPIAAMLPERSVTLVESHRRKCDFLRRTAAELSNVEVVWGRAEEQPPDGYGVGLAKALARPPVAVELVLPLVKPGGIAVLWVGEHADEMAAARVAERLGAEPEDAPTGLLVLRKVRPTPPGFPRRPGMAKKRPLA